VNNLPILDPLRVKKIAEMHAKNLQNADKSKPWTTLVQELHEQVTRVQRLLGLKESFSLEQLKSEMVALYRICTQMQAQHMGKEYPDVLNAFAFRFCEQRPLEIAEFWQQLPKAVKRLERSLVEKNTLQGASLLGTLVGAVGVEKF